MAVVCPTVTANSVAEFNQQMERLSDFAERIHLDFMDGIFAPTKSPSVEHAWWPLGVVADLHVMYQRPLEYLETIISLNPSMVIIHAEADGADEFFHEINSLGIRRGIALLKDSRPDSYKGLIEAADHVLLFSGNLGYFGGTADMSILDKVAQVKIFNSDIEIGWDGGINEHNVSQLVDGGIQVLNVGGFIQKSHDPRAAYDTLIQTLAG